MRIYDTKIAACAELNSDSESKSKSGHSNYSEFILFDISDKLLKSVCQYANA